MKTIIRNGHVITFDEDLALRWIEALEGDEYTQITGYLRTPGGFCCLGVACQVFDATQWQEETEYDDYEHYYQWQESVTDLPEALVASLGLRPDGGRIDARHWGELSLDNAPTLVHANDVKLKSFLDIATALRDYYGFPPRQED